MAGRKPHTETVPDAAINQAFKLTRQLGQSEAGDSQSKKGLPTKDQVRNAVELILFNETNEKFRPVTDELIQAAARHALSMTVMGQRLDARKSLETED